MSTQLRWADLGETFDGPHATPTRQTEGPYFLNIASLRSGRLDLTASDHVAPDDFVKWTKRVTPRAGDLLFSYETRLGEAALMPEGIEACLGRRMALLRPNRDVVDPKFLLYFYLSPKFQRTIEERTIHGATVPRILLSDMPSWPVEVPSLDEQRAIAEVLGALDDKIASNTRAARIAHDLAEVLYSRGMAVLPKVRMSDQLNSVLGGTPKRSEDRYWNGDVPWASAKDVASAGFGIVLSTSECITTDATQETKVKPLPTGSVVLTARGTVGEVARLGVPAAINQSCYGFVPDALPKSVLYFAIRSIADQARSLAHGSVFDTITRRTFDFVEVPDGENAETARLENDLVGLLAVNESLMRENESLARTRDALLPLLMSGRVTVKDAEKVVEEAV